MPVPVQSIHRCVSRESAGESGIAIAAQRELHQPGASMATSSITGADRAPSQAKGRDVEALGPSDTSDSGSDVQGELDLALPTDLDDTIFGTVQPGLRSDSDSGGTGERGAALADEDAREGSDILPDRVTDLAGSDVDDGDTDFALEQTELADIDDDRLATDLGDDDENGSGDDSRS